MISYIAFPKLDLHFDVDPVAISFGDFCIYWYGIIISVAIFVGFFLVKRNVYRFGYTVDDICNILVYAIVFGLLCARAYYVVFNIDEFRHEWVNILNIRTGGLAIYGGVIGALVSIYVYCKKRGYRFLDVVDILMPYLALGQSIGRWGNFTNQEAFGVETTLPWGMTGDIIKGVAGEKLVHPTFLYESLVTLVIFFVLCGIRKRKKVDGEVFFAYMLMYGLARFFIEGLRVDSLMLLNFRVSQVLSAAMVVVAIVFGIIKKKKVVEY